MKKIYSGFVFSSFLFCSQAFANVGEVYSFGSRNAALGGAVVGSDPDGYAAYYNPASMAVEGGKRLKLNWGLLFMQPSFLPIRNVVVQNNYNSDQAAGSPIIGDVDTSDYKPTFGQVFGASYAVAPQFYNLTVGVVSFLPMNQFAFMDTGDSLIPEYFLYRARTQRPQIELALGAHLGHGLSIGFGLHTAFSLNSAADAFMTSRDRAGSSIRFTSELKPKVAPYLGFLYQAQDEKKSWTLGTVFRFAVTSDNSMNFDSGSNIGAIPSLPIIFDSSSALYYDPMALEVGGSWQVFATSRIFFQFDFQMWREFKAPALVVTPAAGSILFGGFARPQNYVNIVIPRFGQEIAVGENQVVRYGYAYRPSILGDLPTGSGNYLDPAKHMINIGFGLKSLRVFGPDVPCSLDFHVSYHSLVPFDVVKTAGNEANVPNDSKIGSPGYRAGGSVWGGGITFLVEL